MQKRAVILETNAFIAGFGNIGITESFKTPALNQIKINHKSGAGDTSVSTGTFESLDSEVTFKSLPKGVYEELSKLDDAEIIHKKATRVGSVVESHEYICRGGMSIEYGEAKAGEFLDVKITQKGLRAYTYEHNNKVVIDIDHDNGKAYVGGKDLAAEARKIVGS